MSVPKNTITNSLTAISSYSPRKLLGGIAKSDISALRNYCYPIV